MCASVEKLRKGERGTGKVDPKKDFGEPLQYILGQQEFGQSILR